MVWFARCRHSIYWEGSAIGLQWFSLRFEDAEREGGFLKMRSRRLLSNVFRFAAVIFIGCICSVLAHLADLPRIQRLGPAAVSVQQFKTAVLCADCCFSFLLMVITGTSAIYNRYSHSNLEMMCMLSLLTLMCLNMALAGGLWTVTKIVGEDPETAWDKTCFCETSTILLADLFVTITHVSLPMRWPLLLAISASAVVWYLTITLIWGDVGREGLWTNFCLFLGMVVVTSFGKRTSEITERRLFAELAKERTLRCETEFKLHQEEIARQELARHNFDNSSDEASLPTTGASQHVFDSFFTGCAQSNFFKLSELGTREHWLISMQDVQLMPKQILGAGSFGLVVTGLFHGAKVAVKFSHSTLHAGAIPSYADVANELRVLRQCRHPNLVQFYGVILDPLERRLAIVFEYMECHSLEIFMHQAGAQVTTTERYDIMLGCCRALCYLHTRLPQIVHGDLKSSNVLVDRRNIGMHPKLADFGLSRILTRRARPLGGTWEWMAPELYNDSPQPKVSSDVFSFGRLVFFTATGIKPLHGQRKKSVKSVLKSGLAPPLDWPGNFPLEEYCKPCVTSCSQVPENLRPSMEQLRQEIEAWPVDSAILFRKGAAEWSKGVNALRKALTSDKKPTTTGALMEKDSSATSAASLYSNTCLDSIPENHAVVSTQQVIMPAFKPTALQTQMQMAASLIQRCNCEITQNACCIWHAAVQSAIKVCKEIGQGDCDSSFVAMVQGQCPECEVLFLKMEADEYCDVCGCLLPFGEEQKTPSLEPRVEDASPRKMVVEL